MAEVRTDAMIMTTYLTDSLTGPSPAEPSGSPVRRRRG